MKKFLLTTLCMLCMVLFAQAQDVAFTFNSTTYGYTKNTNNPKALTIDGVTISFAQGNSSTPRHSIIHLRKFVCMAANRRVYLMAIP